MNRSSIVAIVLFAAALLALLSIGPQATRKIQATFFQTIAPFLKTGSGLERQITSVRITLERCPPELSADLVDRGLVLAGGGALLRGFDRLLSEETGLPVHVAEDPLSAVAEGTGKCLNEIKFLRQVATADRQWRQ